MNAEEKINFSEILKPVIKMYMFEKLFSPILDSGMQPGQCTKQLLFLKKHHVNDSELNRFSSERKDSALKFN